MTQNTQKISKKLFFIFLLITCFSTFFNAHLLGSWEDQRLINDLQNLVEKTNRFFGCGFTLFDPDEPEHKEYYENLETRHAVTTPLWNKLNYELAPKKLYYYH